MEAWRNFRVHTLHSSSGQVQGQFLALGIQMDTLALGILNSEHFEFKADFQARFEVYTLISLGLSQGACITQILANSQQQGLYPVPRAYGAIPTRMRYHDQPDDEIVYIAMEPVPTKVQGDAIFCLHTNSGTRWLRGTPAPHNLPWPPTAQFLFNRLQ